MKAESRLDHAVFQLTPTRTRCELVVSAGDETEKLASGLIEPFLLHIKAANEQLVKGGCSIKLEPPENADDASSWFTKGTVERFVRFVSTPEVLERVCSVEGELLQLEETLNNSSDMRNEASPLSPVSETSSAGESSSGSSQLTKALESRRTVLYKEQSMAFARAVAAGFAVENMESLIRFADYFGASRLRDACENYTKFCMKKRETEVWLEEFREQRTGDPPVFEEKLMEESMELSDGGKAGLCDSPLCCNDSPGEVKQGLSAVSSLESASGHNKNKNVSDELLTVQEKITMFESKKKEDGKRRMSADIVRTETYKPVLRRWSLAVEKIAQQKDDFSKNVGAGEELKLEKLSEVPDEVNEKTDELRLEETREDNGGFPEFSPHSAANGKSSAELSLESSPDGKLEDQKSVMSETQSLKDTKGRLYDKYREKRDARLREEGTSQKAEKQARLLAMQETLEKRRAEVAKNQRSKKSDPLAEARLRAEKLRAFKAGLVELKKEREEEERRRLEDLRIQRQQKKASAAPASPRSGASTPRLIKGMFPTFQRASSIGTSSRNGNGTQAAGVNKTRKSWQASVSQSVPSLAEFKQQGIEKPRRSKQQQEQKTEAPAAIIKPKPSLNKEATHNRLRSMILRKSLSSADHQKGRRAAEAVRLSCGDGLKFIGQSEDPPAEVLPEAADDSEKCEAEGSYASAAEMLIRAPVTAEEDATITELEEEAKEDDEAEEEDEDEEEGEDDDIEEYKAPVAPVSVSALVSL